MDKTEIENKAKYVIADTITTARYRAVSHPEWYGVSEEEKDEVIKKLDEIIKDVYKCMGVELFGE